MENPHERQELLNYFDFEDYRLTDCFYYKGRHECDFIVKRGTKPEAAVQVCWELTPKNEAREFRGLREAMNALAIEEGFVLTNDEERELTFEGGRIRILPVWKWLCMGTEPGHMRYYIHQ